MSVVPPAESGPALDRRIAGLIDGVRNDAAPPQYSTEESQAADVVRRLEAQGITASIEQDADSWYCVFWAPRPGDGTKERVASGGAAARPLAICRAVLNLPLAGAGKRLRLRRASRGWIPDEGGPHPAFAATTKGEQPEGPVASDEDERCPEPSRAAQES
jgi:hypothetical protein